MGWFDEQIKQRKLNDQKIFEDSFIDIAGAVLGDKAATRIDDERFMAKEAIDEILRYYHYKSKEVPDTISDFDRQLEYCLRPYGLMRRNVELTEGWYQDAFGPILAFTKDENKPVALLPGSMHGYYYTDSQTGRKVRLNRHNARNFSLDAICFYRPLPARKIGIPDLMLYISRIPAKRDYILLAFLALSITLIGMLLPRLSKLLTGPILSFKSERLLAATAVFILCTLISKQMITSIQNLMTNRVQTKLQLSVDAAIMMRILSLPADFFRNYSAGELSRRSLAVNSLCSLLFKNIMSTGLMSLTSLLYISQIFQFAPALTIPALLIIMVTVFSSLISSLLQIRISRKQMELSAKEAGMSYALITGIQKIKLAGAEKRAFARWAKLYAKGAELTYNPPVFLKINSVMTTSISLAGNIILYYLAVKNQVDVSSFFAFTASYGAVMGAFTSLAGIALSVAEIPPILQMAEPILKSEPEVAENREVITRISGNIELNNISFRYNENMPYIIKDLSLRIRPGEYVAIVGPTGCGKSTLIRLLLGFEKPERGAIYYDNRDLSKIDSRSLRQNIGVVMQNGELFQGDIFSNITISSPNSTLDDAWKAAETAGIASDIRNMPMGMHTIVSEGGGGLSGGQKQRILIARAIASKPKILIFDEATSALDNKTQKQVSEALDALKCTRIIIAHRLSTIRHCDRILVLDKGHIAENGTYDELIEKKGVFASLVARQRLDKTP